MTHNDTFSRSVSLDNAQVTNKVELRGTLFSPPVFSHESRGEKFYQFTLEIERLSGISDKINVIAREMLILPIDLDGSERSIAVTGELRSFNNKSEEGSKLVITVFAQELAFDNGPDMNIVHLSGALCKKPVLRSTPLGREICNLMLAVNRRYGRSDYLPCIAWGSRAHESSMWDVGDTVVLEGRIQSRCYVKKLGGLCVEKTAYEVSIIAFEQ